MISTWSNDFHTTLSLLKNIVSLHFTWSIPPVLAIKGCQVCFPLNNVSQFTSGKLKIAICSAQWQKLSMTLCEKPLHGKFFNYMRSDNINAGHSFLWLKHSESESSIFAILDQVICTKVYLAKIIRSSVLSLMSRFCFEQEETIQHVLAGCPVLPLTSYIDCHNWIARVVHRHLCKLFDLPLSSDIWFSHKPLPVMENDLVKILWDFGLFTNIRIPNNIPDIVIFMKPCHRIMFVEISCPADVHVFGKEDEKVTKYRPLARKVSTCCNQQVEVVPIIFGHTGVVSCHQQVYLQKIPCYSNSLFQQLQQAALLGTISILRDIWCNLSIFACTSFNLCTIVCMWNHFNDIQ